MHVNYAMNNTILECEWNEMLERKTEFIGMIRMNGKIGLQMQPINHRDP